MPKKITVVLKTPCHKLLQHREIFGTRDYINSLQAEPNHYHHDGHGVTIYYGEKGSMPEVFIPTANIGYIVYEEAEGEDKEESLPVPGVPCG